MCLGGHFAHMTLWPAKKVEFKMNLLIECPMTLKASHEIKHVGFRGTNKIEEEVNPHYGTSYIDISLDGLSAKIQNDMYIQPRHGAAIGGVQVRGCVAVTTGRRY
jgi:hypothetical protein